MGSRGGGAYSFFPCLNLLDSLRLAAVACVDMLAVVPLLVMSCACMVGNEGR